MLNRELEQANDVLRTKRSEVQRIEEEVALLMQVPCCHQKAPLMSCEKDKLSEHRFISKHCGTTEELGDRR